MACHLNALHCSSSEWSYMGEKFSEVCECDINQSVSLHQHVSATLHQRVSAISVNQFHYTNVSVISLSQCHCTNM